MVVDIESTGLPKYHLRADDPSQPRLASLAVILLDQDLLVENEKVFFIKPDGWSMSPEATEVNGITDTHLYQDGIPVMDVLGPYSDNLDAGRIVIGFNSRMDLKIMRGELRRAGLDDRFEKTYSLDMMRISAPVVGLKRKNGAFKWPTLREAYECLVGIGSNVCYHNALSDARCTLEIFRHLKETGVPMEPNVFYSRHLTKDEAGPI
jgi:DNA polymerase-3 subunit epsilon